jgi:hypothetical protein
LVYQTCEEEVVALSEEGAVAANSNDDGVSDMLVTTGVELTAGKHYWEVEILNNDNGNILVGVTRPNLDPTGDCAVRASTNGWFICTYGGTDLWRALAVHP